MSGDECGGGCGERWCLERAQVSFWQWVCSVATGVQARFQPPLQGPQLGPLHVAQQCVLAQIQVPNCVLVLPRVVLPGWGDSQQSPRGWEEGFWGYTSRMTRERLGVAENLAEYQADPSSLITPHTHGETEAQRENHPCQGPTINQHTSCLPVYP